MIRTSSLQTTHDSSLNNDARALVKHVVAGMQDKKAQAITLLELATLENAPTDAYVIAHAASHRQVEAIAQSVEETVRHESGEKPWHREGFENKEWILLDYVNVVVHIMLEEKRLYYSLEELWNDARRIDFTLPLSSI